MPITISTPQPLEPFGPGFNVEASSSFIGPLAAGSHWTAQIVDTASEQTLVTDQVLATTGAVLWTWGAHHSSATLPWLWSFAPPGVTALLRVQLRGPIGELLDDGVQTITWDPVSGSPYVLWYQAQIQAAAGYSTADRLAADSLADQVEVVRAAVTVSWPGLDIVSTVGQLVSHPLGSLIRRETIGPDRSGEGCLTRAGPFPGVNAFGIAWDVITYPPGVGLSQGAPDHWSLPFLQLQTIHTDLDGDEYTSDSAAFRTTDERWYWSTFAPTRVCFWILPGFTVRFHWLTT